MAIIIIIIKSILMVGILQHPFKESDIGQRIDNKPINKRNQ